MLEKKVKKSLKKELNGQQKKLFKHIKHLRSIKMGCVHAERNLMIKKIEEELFSLLTPEQKVLYNLLYDNEELSMEKVAINALEKLEESDFEEMSSFFEFSKNLLIVLDADYEIRIDYLKKNGTSRVFVSSFEHLKNGYRPSTLYKGDFVYLSDKEDENKLKKLFINSMISVSVIKI